MLSFALADLRGDTRDMPSSQSVFFHFRATLSKTLANNRFLPPPLGLAPFLSGKSWIRHWFDHATLIRPGSGQVHVLASNKQNTIMRFWAQESNITEELGKLVIIKGLCKTFVSSKSCTSSFCRLPVVLSKLHYLSCKCVLPFLTFHLILCQVLKVF